MPTTKAVVGTPFRPVRAQPVDLFPYTPHCEMVMMFERLDDREDWSRWDVVVGEPRASAGESSAQEAKEEASCGGEGK